MITGQRLLGNGLPVSVTVLSLDDLTVAKELAAAAAEAQGFDQTNVRKVALVASEMTARMVQCAGSGSIMVRLLESGELGGVELVATDLGPGTAVTGAGEADGDGAVAQSAGGLEAIAGVSDQFELYAAQGRGTVMMSRLWGGRAAAAFDGQFLVGSMMDPFPGEEVSGDGWAVEQAGSRLVALVADGLGHGVAAAAASSAAVEVFRERHREPVEQIVGHIHRALLRTRGAAVAVAEINADAGSLRFCGIGNIAARVVEAGAERNLVSQFGIAGYQRPKIRAWDEAWGQGQLLVMHSDGLSASWDLREYYGLLGHHPQLAAATVMRDAPRANDDALVLALRGADEAVAARAGAVR